MECEFCNFNMNIEPQRIVYEDEDYLAFIAREPAANGHCVIITKDHFEFISQIADVKRFFTFISYLAQSIKDAVNANHVRLEARYGSNNMKINHFHVHLIPAFLDDTSAAAAEQIKNADERILENLRKSQWYGTLNK